MKRFFAFALLGSLLTVPALAVTNGDKAPDFKARASLAGKEFDFSLKDALKKGPVVVYFYPSAYTKGCNMQAHAFAEQADKFKAAGATIIGVSRNTIARLNAFSADPEYCAGKFPVASDADGAIAKAYGLNSVQAPASAKDSKGEDLAAQLTGGLTMDRATYIITPDSKIIATMATSKEADSVAPQDHAEKSLAVIEGLKKK